MDMTTALAGLEFKEQELGDRNQLKIFGLTFVLNIVMAINLAMFLCAVIPAL